MEIDRTGPPRIPGSGPPHFEYGWGSSPHGQWGLGGGAARSRILPVLRRDFFPFPARGRAGERGTAGAPDLACQWLQRFGGRSSPQEWKCPPRDACAVPHATRLDLRRGAGGAPARRESAPLRLTTGQTPPPRLLPCLPLGSVSTPPPAPLSPHPRPRRESALPPLTPDLACQYPPCPFQLGSASAASPPLLRRAVGSWSH